MDQLPVGSTLALASRVRPALGLGRLRAEDRVLEIGLHDLTLEARDGAHLVETAGLRLSAKSTAVLVERAEGWPAGLALAARSLRGRRDAELGGPAVQWRRAGGGAVLGRNTRWAQPNVY